MKNRCKNNENGFTLIELIVSVALSAIMAGAAVPIYNSFNNSVKLDEAATLVAQELRLAQKMSASGVTGAPFGVYLDSGAGGQAVVFYQGVSYAGRDASLDRRTVISSDVLVESTMPSADITFSAGRGLPSEIGTLTFSFADRRSDIMLNEFGLVLEN